MSTKCNNKCQVWFVSLAMHCMGPYLRIRTRVQLVPARGYAHTHWLARGAVLACVPVHGAERTNRRSQVLTLRSIQDGCCCGMHGEGRRGIFSSTGRVHAFLLRLPVGGYGVSFHDLSTSKRMASQHGPMCINTGYGAFQFQCRSTFRFRETKQDVPAMKHHIYYQSKNQSSYKIMNFQW
jgi:hypothetical protein